MRHSDYWRERFEKLEKAQNANGVQYVKRVQKEYDKAIKSLDKDLSYWYTRFAKENGVSYAEAKRLLSTQELKAFRMDVKEYISKGESLDPKWRAELEQASVKVHVSRLEALKLQVQQAAESVSGEFAESFDEFARKTYADQYYKTAYEIQKGLKVGWDVMRLDKNKIDKVIRKPWASDGRNFSERVWANRSKLVNELHTNLTQGIIRGDSPQKTIAALSKRMDVSKVAAGRLIMTEHAFFSSAANRDVLKELEVEKYEILATLDSRTSQTCRDMDGKVFNRSEYEVGITAPPFHVWCRTTTVPYFDDEEEGFRAARNKDGEYYLVPESMSYRDWEKAFVEGGSKEGLEKIKPEDVAPKLSWIDEIRQIKALGDNAKESDIMRAGELFMNQVKENIPDVSKLDEEIENLFLERKKILAPIIEKYELLRPTNTYKAFFSNELSDEYKAWVEEFKKEREKASSEIDKKIEEVTNQRKELKNVTKRFLKEIRSIGYDDSLVNKHLTGSRKMKPVVMEAYQFYPSEWVEKSIDEGKLKVKDVARGYYSHFKSEIAISGRGEQSLSTAIHELGHRFERTTDLTKWEKVFYDRRTEGEDPVWLGGCYAKTETTRKDNFVNPYIGKDYGGQAYEIVSMGFQYAFTDVEKLLQDEDYAKFIFGLLTTR